MAGLFPPGLLPCEATFSSPLYKSPVCALLHPQELGAARRNTPKYGGAPGMEQHHCGGSQAMGPGYLSIVLTSLYSDRLAELASPWQGPAVCSHPTVTHAGEQGQSGSWVC